MATGGKGGGFGHDCPERVPGLARTGTCCVERTRRRKGRETVPPACRRNAARLLEPMAGTLGDWWVRDVVFGEDLPGENGVGAATAGGAAEPRDRDARLSGVKNIAAALRHYAWKPWETLTLIGLPANN